MKIVIDAWAWIELLIGSDKDKEVKALIENAEEAYTPSTVLAESPKISQGRSRRKNNQCLA